MRCPPEQRVACEVSLLQSEAYDWRKLVLKCPRFPDPIPLDFFIQEFRAKYVTDKYKEPKWKQFLNLKQREAYQWLSTKKNLAILATEAFQCRQFEDGLNESIKRYLASVTSLQQVNFYQLVQAAMKVERFEASSKERFRRRSFQEELLPPQGKELGNLQLN